MDIHVASSTGTASTKLSAFDAALYNAGIANYNLLLLSSVIPPQSEIHTHKAAIQAPMPGNWGDRLYVVMAQQIVDVPGDQAWAGIGWVQDPRTKQGLFVEHEGSNEQSVRQDITSSLESLMKTRGIDYGEIKMQVTGVTCVDEPACAMTVAVYQSTDWLNQPHLFERA